MLKIILTGTDGFIGGNIYKELQTKDSCLVTKLDLEFFQSSDYKFSLEKIFEEHDYPIHIGANSDTQESDVNKIMNTNYYISKQLFELANNYNVKVIYSSSAAVYGTSGMPENLYAWTKLIAEDFGIANNKEFVSMRYFNVYGPGEENKGQMSSIAYQAWGEKEIKLFPNKPTRDFVYIDDVVEATLFPVFNEYISGIYEVGTGESRLFEDIINLLGINYTYTSEEIIPKGYQFKTRANTKNFYPGWSPKFSLEKGIEKYLEYLRVL